MVLQYPHMNLRRNSKISDIDEVLHNINNKESIVIYRDVGGIGDAVMITGAIHGLRKEWGSDIIIIIATIPYCAPVFYYNPDVDYIIDSSQFDRVHKDGKVDYGGGKNICRSVFESAGSLFISLSHECPCSEYESANEPGISKSRQRLFAEACGLKYHKGYCKVYTDSEELEGIKDLIPYDKYIVYQCKSTERSRNIPGYHNKKLIHILSRKLNDIGYGLVILSYNSNIRGSNITNISDVSLRNSISIISRSIMLVGIDSMGVHIAGACGVPVYGIFGPTDPEMRLSDYSNTAWYKGYSKCKREPCWYHPCLLNFCMRSISMDDLASDIVWQLNSNNKYGG